MEIINDPNQPDFKKYQQRQQRGRILAGLIILGIGVTLFLRKIGYFIPDWVISWKMLLIVIGLFIGFKHGFVRMGWIFPVLIGFAFLIGDIFPNLAFQHFILPAVFIAIGLYMIFRPKRTSRYCGDYGHHHHNKWSGFGSSGPVEGTPDDRVEVTSVFGGIKKNIISKDFKGGEINSVFGGSEINMMQADINGRVELEANQIFGGTKLIIPSIWQVHSEMTAVMGGIEDRRPVALSTDPNKVLVLKGTCVLGGLEIVSY